MPSRPARAVYFIGASTAFNEGVWTAGEK